MFKKLYTLSIASLLALATLSAQDIHFSNFEALAAPLNPALTGFIPGEGGMRLAAVHRNQWQSALGDASFTTKGIALDMRNCIGQTTQKAFKGLKQKFQGPTWGLGISYIRDETGVRSVKDISDQSFPLIRDYAHLSASLILPVNDQFFISGGFRVGGIFNRFRTEHLRYDEQFDGVAGFDSSIAGEFDNIAELESNQFNLGGGLSTFYVQKGWGFNGGIAIDHSFIPVRYDFLDSEDNPTLRRRIAVHAKGSFILLKNTRRRSLFGLNPKLLLFNQNPYRQWIVGTDFFFQQGSDFSATIGGGLRITRHTIDVAQLESALVNVSFSYRNFTAQFNYDFNASSLRTVTRKYGALECTLIYRWKKKKSKCASPLETGPCVTDGKNIHPIFI